MANTRAIYSGIPTEMHYRVRDGGGGEVLVRLSIDHEWIAALVSAALRNASRRSRGGPMEARVLPNRKAGKKR